ncbi:amino acid carrier protein [Sphingobacterium sp. DK4209]|uniref:Amino acid carrier protein n=1 Tax=Sphingobacterium zhuxiongii TaxID=2662364 RepID=A0A5Q0Q7G8_9SPHI|nr:MULTISPECIES: alanine/glycine:cation symporter family protein [unclassified Sphingobacterium]MVZ65055.1 amino acid carrier protein [Sphingobacterium sp. DK4209]QGA26005.1 amino acid carrier protein [Sphingobacterium sp. dk4302]
MDKFVSSISSLVWSDIFIYLCLCTGLYFSIRTGFLQVTYIKDMLKLLFAKKQGDEGISSFQAFALAISGRVGTGNIIGVATAIFYGGPGAVFWMWAIAFLGSASAFVEAMLGQVYKQKDGTEFRGGPAYYIEKGLGVKWYAVLFAVLTIISAGLLLPGVQSNAIASSIHNAFEIPTSYTGIAVVLLLILIIFGGVKRLGTVAEYVVPFMAGGYILMTLVIIAMNFQQIPEVFELIFSSAFSLDATFGGIIGMAIAWGVKRGIYSNEAGQGTAPHAAAAAEVSHPAQQGLVQAFSVYVDTLFVCTATALMILFTGKYNVTNTDAARKATSMLQENLPGVDYNGFTQAAVSHHFPGFGDGFVAVALFFFAFTTIMAYFYYADTNIVYLVKNEKTQKILGWIFKIVFLGSVYYGTVRTADTAWAIGDIGVGLMAWVNLIAILLMSKTAMKVWNDYKKKRKQGIENPDFNPKEIGVKNADYWESKNQ